MIRRPPRSTLSSSSAASDVYKRQVIDRGSVEALVLLRLLGQSHKVFRSKDVFAQRTGCFLGELLDHLGGDHLALGQKMLLDWAENPTLLRNGFGSQSSACRPYPHPLPPRLPLGIQQFLLIAHVGSV